MKTKMKIIIISVIVLIFLIVFKGVIFYPRFYSYFPPSNVSKINGKNWLTWINRNNNDYEIQQVKYTDGDWESITSDKVLYGNGCLAAQYYNLVNKKTNTLITNHEALAKDLGGINTPEQAMAFIYSLSDYIQGTDIQNSILTPQYAIKNENGFKVGFALRQICGCEHSSYHIEVQVNTDGTYKEITNDKMSVLPVGTGICVD